MQLKDKVVVLVPSCDKYADLWRPFFTLFWRFWPDCPFSVCLLSNFATMTDARVRVLPVGEDVSWSDNLARTLGKLNYEYVLLFLDDLFLAGYVATRDVLNVMDWAVWSQVNYVRLNPSQKPDKQYNDIAGVVSPGTVYRTSTVMSAWKKEIILHLLRPDESAWEFEIKGSVRSDNFGGFFSTYKKHFPVINAVIKGKWRPCAVKKVGSLGVEIDLSSRPVMKRIESVIFFCKQQRSKLLNIVPSRHRRAVRSFVLKEQVNLRVSP